MDARRSWTSARDDLQTRASQLTELGSTLDAQARRLERLKHLAGLPPLSRPSAEAPLTAERVSGEVVVADGERAGNGPAKVTITESREVEVTLDGEFFRSLTPEQRWQLLEGWRG